MSISYRILCVSHAPALEVATGDNGWEWNRPEQALAAIADHSRVIAHHRTCDLIVYGNYYNTFYCPPSSRCAHTDTEPIESSWISLAAAAMRHDELKGRVDQLTGCWTADRIDSLAGYFARSEDE
jgi:hypothetical protein